MVLDEDNAILYLKDRKVRLSEIQNLLLSFLISSPTKTRHIKDVSEYVYVNSEKKNKTYNYDYRLSGLIYRLNKKLYPYIQIEYKANMYCKIVTNEYTEEWKIEFRKNHKNSYKLLKKKEQVKKIEKDIQLLYKEIKNY